MLHGVLHPATLDLSHLCSSFTLCSSRLRTSRSSDDTRSDPSASTQAIIFPNASCSCDSQGEALSFMSAGPGSLEGVKRSENGTLGVRFELLTCIWLSVLRLLINATLVLFRILQPVVDTLSNAMSTFEVVHPARRRFKLAVANMEGIRYLSGSGSYCAVGDGSFDLGHLFKPWNHQSLHFWKLGRTTRELDGLICVGRIPLTDAGRLTRSRTLAHRQATGPSL
jgi:hypothetical protein